jgi:hypothetical protein
MHAVMSGHVSVCLPLRTLLESSYAVLFFVFSSSPPFLLLIIIIISHWSAHPPTHPPTHMHTLSLFAVVLVGSPTPIHCVALLCLPFQ